MMRIVVDETGRHLDAAARIWAEATSARDQDDEVPPLALSRPIIERVLQASPRAFLLIVLDEDERPAAFAAIGPVPEDETMAELHYVGVEPASWGRSFGAMVMVAAPDVLVDRGFSDARLLVYVDNERATRLYERCGWRPHGKPSPNPRNGKAEREYRLVLKPIR